MNVESQTKPPEHISGPPQLFEKIPPPDFRSVLTTQPIPSRRELSVRSGTRTICRFAPGAITCAHSVSIAVSRQATLPDGHEPGPLTRNSSIEGGLGSE
jgi:hypothetical protein